MLPARVNVAEFLQSFSEKEGENENKIEVEEMCKGLCSYFDSTLGTQLLYKFERIQYSDIMKVMFSHSKFNSSRTKQYRVAGAPWCVDVQAVSSNPPA